MFIYKSLLQKYVSHECLLTDFNNFPKTSIISADFQFSYMHSETPPQSCPAWEELSCRK